MKSIFATCFLILIMQFIDGAAENENPPEIEKPQQPQLPKLSVDQLHKAANSIVDTVFNFIPREAND
ncbi:unnamed protein product [Dracunculus medinensis]|uniref:Uncharacterized protein n=1 Tax=Dracunculus medinensis TaxID=318479 RepID=A0A0N4UJE3_DRAME|nr:unnamed protein product [Dracunculus medinensis]